MGSSKDFEQQLDHLSEAQLRELLELIVEEDPEDWEFQPADPIEFIDSRDYCNLQRECAPVIKKEFAKIFDGEPLRWVINLAVLVCAIGFGKSYMLSLIMAYVAHCLLCLRNPPTFFSKYGFNISPGSKLSIVNASVSKQNARKVVFTEVLNRIAHNRWFLRHYPPDDRIKSELIFDPVPDRNVDRIKAMDEGRIFKNVCITPGSSSMTGMVGYSVFCGVMDEASLYRSQHGEDLASLVYNAMDRRIDSRFGDMGLRVVAGSPMYVGDFLEHKSREITITNNKRGHVVRRPIWERHYPHWFENKMPVFHVNIENFSVVVDPDEYEPPTEKWIKVPKTEEYLRAFRTNPEGALRDLAAIPSAAIVQFFENPELVDKYANHERIHPLDADDRFLPYFSPDPAAFYTIHIDVAIGGKQFRRLDQVEIESSRDRKHDACGIAMGHISNYTKEGRPVICLDFMHLLHGKLERTGPEGQDFERGAIRFDEIAGWIDALLLKGFKIATATLDGFQSAQFMQDLQKRGLDVRYLSMDRSVAPYIDLKETLLDRRLDYYPHPQLLEELKHLEKVGGKKIDHAPGSSKDLADAAAGVVHTLIVSYGNGAAQDFDIKVY